MYRCDDGLLTCVNGCGVGGDGGGQGALDKLSATQAAAAAAGPPGVIHSAAAALPRPLTKLSALVIQPPRVKAQRPLAAVCVYAPLDASPVRIFCTYVRYWLSGKGEGGGVGHVTAGRPALVAAWQRDVSVTNQSGE